MKSKDPRIIKMYQKRGIMLELFKQILMVIIMNWNRVKNDQSNKIKSPEIETYMEKNMLESPLQMTEKKRLRNTCARPTDCPYSY